MLLTSSSSSSSSSSFPSSTRSGAKVFLAEKQAELLGLFIGAHYLSSVNLPPSSGNFVSPSGRPTNWPNHFALACKAQRAHSMRPLHFGRPPKRASVAQRNVRWLHCKRPTMSPDDLGRRLASPFCLSLSHSARPRLGQAINCASGRTPDFMALRSAARF